MTATGDRQHDECESYKLISSVSRVGSEFFAMNAERASISRFCVLNDNLLVFCVDAQISMSVL